MGQEKIRKSVQKMTERIKISWSLFLEFCNFGCNLILLFLFAFFTSWFSSAWSFYLLVRFPVFFFVLFSFFVLLFQTESNEALSMQRNSRFRNSIINLSGHNRPVNVKMHSYTPIFTPTTYFYLICKTIFIFPSCLYLYYLYKSKYHLTTNLLRHKNNGLKQFFKDCLFLMGH